MLKFCAKYGLKIKELTFQKSEMAIFESPIDINGAKIWQ